MNPLSSIIFYVIFIIAIDLRKFVLYLATLLNSDINSKSLPADNLILCLKCSGSIIYLCKFI